MRRTRRLGKHRGMTDAPHLLIAWHSRTGGSEALARAAADGAGRTARLVAAADVTPGQLQAAGGADLGDALAGLAAMLGRG